VTPCGDRLVHARVNLLALQGATTQSAAHCVILLFLSSSHRLTFWRWSVNFHGQRSCRCRNGQRAFAAIHG
jgi:hypothetical protein